MAKEKHTLKCSQCGAKYKTLSEGFYKYKAGKDGYMNKCKTCFKKEQQRRNEANRLERAATKKKYKAVTQEGNTAFIELSTEDLEIKYERLLKENEELKEAIKWQRETIKRLACHKEEKEKLLKI